MFLMIFNIILGIKLFILVSPKVTNITSDIAGHVYSSNDILHSLQDPHLSAVARLEDEANRAADLHHVGYF